MRNVSTIWTSLIVSFLILGSCSRKENKEAVDEAKRATAQLSPQEFKAELATMSDAVLIDVRKPEEFAGGTIEGAINIDFTDSTFQDKISDLDRVKPYFVYCKSGKRSAGAVSAMEKLGFEKIYILDGGYTNWVDEGMETVKP